MSQYIDREKHVGKTEVAIDIGGGGSTSVRAIVSADADIAEILKRLHSRLNEVVRDILGGELEYHTFGDSTDIVDVRLVLSETVLTKDANKARSDKLMDEISDAFAESDKCRAEQLEADPNNGKVGWWSVSGIRHDAIVRASSASEAVKKANEDGAVGGWEFGTASFIGEELPDVVGI